jgi:hypothetical protein
MFANVRRDSIPYKERALDADADPPARAEGRPGAWIGSTFPSQGVA